MLSNCPPRSLAGRGIICGGYGQKRRLQFYRPAIGGRYINGLGGYVDKLEQFNQDFGPVNWQNINAKATDPQGVKLVIAAPQNSAEGLAALISGVSTHLGKQSLTEQDIGQADAWLTETLGNRNAQTPPRPAEGFAGVQGRTLGDMGLLSLASWQRVDLDTNSNFAITPVTPTVTLDYPYAVWAGENATQEINRQPRRSVNFYWNRPTRSAGHIFAGSSGGQFRQCANKWSRGTSVVKLGRTGATLDFMLNKLLIYKFVISYIFTGAKK